jgi:hypothetical protein
MICQKAIDPGTQFRKNTLTCFMRGLRAVSSLTTLSTWLAVLVVSLAVYAAWPKRMARVRSELTGKWYRVKNLPDAQVVADRLAHMEVRLEMFLRKAEEYAPGEPRLANIRARWNGTLAETLHDPEIAYSMGKDAISLCVRREDGRMESENTAMFVLLHELAHVATDKYGHTPEFWTNMKLLLELAEATGFYTYQDFDTGKVTYCGRALSQSPLTCVKKGSCQSELRRLNTTDTGAVK